MSIVVAITGASGAIYGLRMLEVLAEKNFETHLVITKTAKNILRQETEKSVEEIESLASYHYDDNDLMAPIASGGFKTIGMIIAPCSMKTLAAISSGFSNNLVSRAADVTLKERRTLVLVPRETPFSAIHIRNMLRLANIGAIILPPIPAFYNSPKSINDLVDHTIGKILECYGVEHTLYRKWKD